MRTGRPSHQLMSDARLVPIGADRRLRMRGSSRDETHARTCVFNGLAWAARDARRANVVGSIAREMKMG